MQCLIWATEHGCAHDCHLPSPQDEQLPLGTVKGEDASSEEADFQKPVHMS